MEITTISETFTLPSRGKIYTGKKVSDTITLRSMTTEEEMMRLSHSKTPYKKLCDIMDKCILNDVGISTYDMCVGDYQFVLYKLRTVTYGPEYLNASTCPFCGQITSRRINLDDLIEFDLDDDGLEDFNKLFTVTLPRTKATVELKYQTPRTLEQIDKDIENYNKQFPENTEDMSLIISLQNSIKTIDGQHYDPLKLQSILRKLPMMDTNFLNKTITKINNEVGISNLIQEKCKNPECGEPYYATFRITSEFFGPTI